MTLFISVIIYLCQCVTLPSAIHDLHYTGGADTCVACAAGQTSAAGSVSHTNCTACAAGQYAAAAAPKCSLCDAGKSVDAGKGVQAGDCVDCAAGYYAVSGAACSACPVGKYVEAGNGRRPGDCNDCPAGKYEVERAFGRRVCLPHPLVSPQSTALTASSPSRLPRTFPSAFLNSQSQRQAQPH